MAGTSVIGTLALSISARTGKFKKQMTRAAKTVDKFGRVVEGTAKKIAKLSFAFGGLAAGGLAFYARQQAKEIDRTAKFANRIGLTTERLVGLQLAFRRTGVEVKQGEIGLQRMTRRISEAAQGAGEAQGAIQELGLDAATLAKLDPAQQFERIADAMREVTNQGDRVRLAMRLFDSEGVALVNTLAAGSEGLQSWQKEAEKLRLTFSGAQGAAVEAANDAIGRMGDSITGLIRTLTVTLAKPIEKMANRLAELFSSDKFRKRFIDVIKNGVALLARALAAIVGMLADLKVAFDRIKSFFGGGSFWGGVGRLGTRGMAAGLGGSGLRRRMQRAGRLAPVAAPGATTKAANALRELQKAIEEFAKGVPKAIDRMAGGPRGPVMGFIGGKFGNVDLSKPRPRGPVMGHLGGRLPSINLQNPASLVQGAGLFAGGGGLRGAQAVQRGAGVLGSTITSHVSSAVSSGIRNGALDARDFLLSFFSDIVTRFTSDFLTGLFSGQNVGETVAASLTGLRAGSPA